MSKYAEVNGVKIYYEETGCGDHVVLLMPGGLGSTKTDFAPQLEKMDKDRFRILAWDPRGYGQSRPPDRTWGEHFLKRDADDAAALMQKLGHTKYSLLGWSDGGITALILAANYPDHVQKVVAWGANSFITKPEMGNMNQVMKDPDKWSPRMRKPFEDLYGREYLKKLCVEWVEAIERFSDERSGNICEEELPNIRCPTLIIHGDKDPLVADIHCEHLHKNIKGSRLYRMPEGKHNLHLRYADEFNSLVEKFLLEEK